MIKTSWWAHYLTRYFKVSIRWSRCTLENSSIDIYQLLMFSYKIAECYNLWSSIFDSIHKQCSSLKLITISFCKSIIWCRLRRACNIYRLAIPAKYENQNNKESWYPEKGLTRSERISINIHIFCEIIILSSWGALRAFEVVRVLRVFYSALIVRDFLEHFSQNFHWGA